MRKSEPPTWRLRKLCCLRRRSQEASGLFCSSSGGCQTKHLLNVLEQRQHNTQWQNYQNKMFNKAILTAAQLMLSSLTVSLGSLSRRKLNLLPSRTSCMISVRQCESENHEKAGKYWTQGPVFNKPELVGCDYNNTQKNCQEKSLM